MFRDNEKYRSNSGSIAIEHHDTSYRQMALSFLVGTGATYLASCSYGWMFSLAVGGIATAVCYSGVYAQARSSRISTIPSCISHNANTSKKTATQTLPNINNSHMANTNPDNVSDHSLFYMGFCSKRGFADLLEGGNISYYLFEKSPFKHSSIMFVPIQIMQDLNHLCITERDSYLVNKKGILVFGRQSTAFRMNSTTNFWKSPFKETTKTIIDNESFYELFDGAAFEPLMTDVVLSGKEIKEIVRRVNMAICNNDDQFCDMFHSNCYSASIFMLATAIAVLHERHTNILECMNERVDLDLHPLASLKVHTQLEELCILMLDVLTHNKGQGVINNKAVVNQINFALKIASEFNTEKTFDVILKNLGLRSANNSSSDEDERHIYKLNYKF